MSGLGRSIDWATYDRTINCALNGRWSVGLHGDISIFSVVAFCSSSFRAVLAGTCFEVAFQRRALFLVNDCCIAYDVRPRRLANVFSVIRIMVSCFRAMMIAERRVRLVA